MGQAVADLIIDSGAVDVAPGDPPGSLAGSFKGTGVQLDEARVEADGRLLVLGGNGDAGSVPAGAGLPSFVNNDNWYDDTSDGIVTATVDFGNGAVSVNKEARVIGASPAFAPGIHNMITLFDVRVSGRDTDWHTRRSAGVATLLRRRHSPHSQEDRFAAVGQPIGRIRTRRRIER